jgi:hypothetical protein
MTEAFACAASGALVAAVTILNWVAWIVRRCTS